VAAGPPAGPGAGFGDAERDRLTIVLREHYALGRLDEAEFDRRLGIVLSADDAAAAAAALDGLPLLIPRPAGQTGQAPASGRRSRRRHAQVTAPDPAGCPPPSGSGTRRAAPSCGSGWTRPTAAATTSLMSRAKPAAPREPAGTAIPLVNALRNGYC